MSHKTFRLFETEDILVQAGLRKLYESSSQNSSVARYGPGEGKNQVEDMFVFTSYHMNSGTRITFVWVETLDEATMLYHSPDNGLPEFAPLDREELQVLIRCLSRT